MKKQLLSLLTLVLIVLISCNSKKEEASSDNATAESEEWKEMDSFHMIMAEAFHPYKDSSNLAPAKKLAEEMAAEADKWAAASLPAKVNNDNVKQQLEKLKADTRAFADQVKASTADADLGTALNTLHDNFHGIMEAWHGGGEIHEHKH
jgi:hypothetical protein